MWKQISYHATSRITGNICWKSPCSTWFWKHFKSGQLWMLLPPRAQLSFLAAIIERIAFIREPLWLRILRDHCCSEMVSDGRTILYFNCTMKMKFFPNVFTFLLDRGVLQPHTRTHTPMRAMCNKIERSDLNLSTNFLNFWQNDNIFILFKRLYDCGNLLKRPL